MHPNSSGRPGGLEPRSLYFLHFLLRQTHTLSMVNEPLTFSTYAQHSGPGQSGEAHIFPVQDDNLTAELPLRRSILQSTLQQKYRSAGDITDSVTAVLRKDFIGFTRLPWHSGALHEGLWSHSQEGAICGWKDFC